METSEQIKSIGAALGVFHTKVAKIAKTDNNPFFKSKYAGLPSILEAIQKPLEESNLVFTQHPDGGNLTTMLIHTESGEFFRSSYSMNPVKTDPQSIGSAITYARRYALGAILGLNIDEDDDGNKASQPTPKAQAPHPSPTHKAEPELKWLNLLDVNGNPKKDVLDRVNKFFSMGSTIDELKKLVKISKTDQEYIESVILS